MWRVYRNKAIGYPAVANGLGYPRGDIDHRVMVLRPKFKFRRTHFKVSQKLYYTTAKLNYSRNWHAPIQNFFDSAKELYRLCSKLRVKPPPRVRAVDTQGSFRPGLNN